MLAGNKSFPARGTVVAGGARTSRRRGCGAGAVDEPGLSRVYDKGKEVSLWTGNEAKISSRDGSINPAGRGSVDNDRGEAGGGAALSAASQEHIRMRCREGATDVGTLIATIWQDPWAILALRRANAVVIPPAEAHSARLFSVR